MEEDVYEITLKKEVLLEVWGGIYAKLSHYEDRIGSCETNENRLLFAMKKTIVAAQYSILSVKTHEELDRIRGQFDFVRTCLQYLKED